MGDKDDKFVQGIAYAIGWIIQAHGFESIGIELLESSGYSYTNLLTAHCDKKDLSPIANALGLRLDGTPRRKNKGDSK